MENSMMILIAILLFMVLKKSKMFEMFGCREDCNTTHECPTGETDCMSYYMAASKCRSACSDDSSSHSHSSSTSDKTTNKKGKKGKKCNNLRKRKEKLEKRLKKIEDKRKIVCSGILTADCDTEYECKN